MGNPSKAFNPFILPADMKESSVELKNKIMVDFDPLRCFLGDIEVSAIKFFCFNTKSIIILYQVFHQIYVE